MGGTTNLATYLLPALAPHQHTMEKISAISALFTAIASLVWYFLKGSSFPPFIVPYLLFDLFLESKRDMLLHHVITLCLFIPLIVYDIDFKEVSVIMKGFLLMEVSTIFLNLFWLHTNGVVLVPPYIEYTLIALFTLSFFKFRVYDFTKLVFNTETFRSVFEQLGSTNGALAYFIPLLSMCGLNLHWAVKILKKLGRMTGLLPRSTRHKGVATAAAAAAASAGQAEAPIEEPTAPLPLPPPPAETSNPSSPRATTPETDVAAS